MDQFELVERVAKELGISSALTRRLLKATLREVRDLLRVGHAVTILHLGAFDTTTYGAHRGYRSVSYDFAIFPKRRVPVFRTGTLPRWSPVAPVSAATKRTAMYTSWRSPCCPTTTRI